MTEKKHTFGEHLADVTDAYCNMHSVRDPKIYQPIVWFTAYERWLNDRSLMSEEDPSVKEMQW